MKRARLVLPAVLGGLAFLASCTLIGSRDITQCDSDGDCADVAGRNSCVDNLCVAKTTGGGGEGGDAEGGGPDAPVDGTGPACKVTDDCPNLDHVCSKDGECIPLAETGICSGTLPAQERPWRLPNAGPIVGVYAAAGIGDSLERRVVDAALKVVNTSVSSPITLLFCAKGDKDSRGTALDAVKYLERRRVPLVYGQFESVELAKLTSTNLAVWSTLGNTSQSEADAGAASGKIRFLVDELRHLAPTYQTALDEALTRVENHLPPLVLDQNNLRVFTVVSTSPESAPLETAIFDTVTARGSTLAALRAAHPDNFRSYKIDATFDVPVPNTPRMALDEIPALKPHVVLAIGGDEIFGLLSKLEPSNQADAPQWIVTSRAKVNANAIFNVISAGASLRHRFIGVDFPGSPGKLQAMRTSLSTKDPGALAFDHLYDSTIALALAVTRAQTVQAAKGAVAPLSADDLDQALDVFSPDAPDAVTMNGADALAATLNAVRAGSLVKFLGTTGEWRFFPNGSRNTIGAPGTYFCYEDERSPSTQKNELKLYQPATELDAGGLANCARY